MNAMNVDALALGIAVLLVASVTTLGYGILALARRPNRIAERLSNDPFAPAAAFPALPLAARPERGASTLARLLSPIARVAMPINRDELERLRLRLQQGGVRSEHAATFHVAAKMLLALGGTIVLTWVNSRRTQPIEPAFVVAVLAFASGFYLPDLLLRSRVKERQTAIERGLPDALDLLVTCVEAGLGLDAAVQRVSDEVSRAWPLLGEELHTTFLEVKAGMPRVDAFRRLATRTGVPDLKSLAATLNQTETFGTSVALALRIQAETIRVRRMHRAEERAAYVSVKMTIPLILCILPSLFAILMGPAALNIASAFSRMAGGR